jgi:Na+/H+-dicarboxylate symporter
MTYQIIIATVLGIISGVIFGERLQFTRFFGDIFLRLIQMSISLLVMGHVVEAVGNINPKELGKLGVKTFSIFITSSFMAAAWGILMGSVFRPGSGVDASGLSGTETLRAGSMSVSETILNFIPSNIIRSMADNTIIHVILFGILFGMAAGFVALERNDRRLLDIISLFNKTIIRMISGIMKIAPAAICIILATTIGRLGVKIVVPLIKYLAVYGLATLVFWIAWQLIVCLICRVNFFRLVKNTANISLMALATTSSAVTLPTTLKDSQEKCGISEKIAKLVLPLGMSLNCNGAAMHMAITVVTIAQIYGVSYDAGNIIFIVVLATLASMANAVVPGAGLVSLTIVVPAMALPIESIALFASVDWFVGMMRTILNVDADVYTALIVGRSEKAVDFSVFNGIKNDERAA